MLDRRLLEHDPLTGETEYYCYDDVEDTFSIETVVDVEPLIELNKAQFNAQEKHTRWGDGARVASIPLSIYFELKRKGILDDPAEMTKWLNDPDNRVFRTRPGRVVVKN